LRTCRVYYFKPTLLTLRSILFHKFDIEIAVALIQMMDAINYVVIMTLVLVSLAWAPSLPANGHEVLSNAIVMTTSLVFYAITFANLASTVETNNVVVNGFNSDTEPVKHFMSMNNVEPVREPRGTHRRRRFLGARRGAVASSDFERTPYRCSGAASRSSSTTSSSASRA